MTEKANQAKPWIISLFIGGIVLSAIGLTKGQDIASLFSRSGVEFWTISEGMILGATFIPIMIGVSMMILAMVFGTVLFIHWLKEPTKDKPGTGTGNVQAAE